MTRTATHPSIASSTVLTVGTLHVATILADGPPPPRTREKWCAGVFCLICTTKIVSCCG